MVQKAFDDEVMSKKMFTRGTVISIPVVIVSKANSVLGDYQSQPTKLTSNKSKIWDKKNLQLTIRDLADEVVGFPIIRMS